MKTINRNWKEIKRQMTLSLSTDMGWVKYSQIISSGLSNHVLTTSDTGQIQYFVEKLPYYARITSEELKYGCRLSDEQIIFIRTNEDFLKTIKS